MQRNGVAPLLKPSGELAVGNTDKANVLNRQFSFVFAKAVGLAEQNVSTNIQLSTGNFSPERVRKFMCKLFNKLPPYHLCKRS